MAQLDVEPKRNTSWWIWVLLTIFALAALFYFVRGCGRDMSDPDLTGGDSSFIRNAENTEIQPNIISSAGYDEITDSDINVRGGDGFVVYALEEAVLFDSDQSTIRREAEPKLMQISASLKGRFKNAKISIYGFTDSVGSKAYNKDLAAKRAEAVRNWIARSVDLQAEEISLNPVGEARPVASNATEEGRQANRRVEIIARNQK